MGNQKSTYKWYNSQKSDFQNVLAINHDNSVLAVGNREEIKIFKILHYKEYNVENLTEQEEEELYASEGKALKQLLICDGNIGYVTTLQFLQSEKHANFFLSGSEHLINIWAPDDQLMPYCWQSKFKIEWTYSKINCVIIHPNENLIISGDNENVKLWQQQDQYVCQQIINEHKMPIYGLSISPDGKKLISIGADQNLFVMTGLEKETLQVIQKIQFNELLLRICFITNQIFTLQSSKSSTGSKNLQIFKMDLNEKFQIAKNISLQGKGQHDLGDCQPNYIPSKQILMIKSGYSINIIRFILYNPQFKGLDGEFDCQLEQSINFGHDWVFGTISHDGQFLITWDSKSHKTQIKKYYQKMDQQI
ncbi:unnamed protein product [Paramecium pentaurelia]|uniref:WD40-repeat-containing domain n=1 Tax=Paramecium pentaurelia TaxID=43138 RepID=A0A8S1WIR8_9CILI|nr:unnamed protein product [Paramecium pentaurelia]